MPLPRCVEREAGSHSVHLIQACSRVVDVCLGDNIVAIKRGSGPVPGNFHRDALGNPVSHDVANRRSAEVVKQLSSMILSIC
jgi:hypothetical protein